MNVTDLTAALEFFGYLLRPFGVLIFGLAVGWLTIRIVKMEAQGWQLRMATMLGLLATFVLLGHWVPGGGTLGAFGLGAGAGLLIWGLTGRAAEEKRPRRPKD